MVKPVDKEEIILKAAMDVFIEKGRHGARMQEIADCAGINKALLHYYFRSKDKLYEQIFEKLFSKFVVDMTMQFNSDDNFVDALNSFIDKFVDFISKNPKIPVFIVRELGEGGKFVGDLMSKLAQQEPKRGPVLALEFIKKAQAKGELRQDIDPMQFLFTVIGSCVYFFVAEPLLVNALQLQENFDRRQFIEERKKSIFDTLYNGVKP